VETNDALLDSAIESFEPNFFNNLILVLDNYFCNRSRTKENKNGNPLNEEDFIQLSKAFLLKLRINICKST